MKNQDSIRLIDHALAREIIAMDKAELLRFVLSREDELRARSPRRSLFVLPIDPRRKGTTADVVARFYDDDPSHVAWPLIEDLCWLSADRVLNYWTTVGYLDDISSASPLTLKGVVTGCAPIPWPDDSDTWYWAKRIDFIGPAEIALMLDSLQENQPQIDAAEYTTELLHLQTIHAKLSTDPSLKAAYVFASSEY